MKADVYSLSGKQVRKIELPSVFEETHRPDLIRRAVNTIQANRRQPYGPSPGAGMRHAVSTWGKGRGVARVQRITGDRRAAQSPNNVGGRRAHPPRPEHSWKEKMNKKEMRKALRSAIAATSDTEMVSDRGHRFKEDLKMPVVLEDEFEDFVSIVQKKVDEEDPGGPLWLQKEFYELAEKIGIDSDLVRARNGRKIRAGRGTMRGRKYRYPNSFLIVVSRKEGMEKAVRNLPGLEVVTVRELNAEHLAPGGAPGRLTVFSEKALKEMEGL
jgi:large subunit ribosomal protein L4e